jgi:hypothetical protein
MHRRWCRDIPGRDRASWNRVWYDALTGEPRRTGTPYVGCSLSEPPPLAHLELA